MTEGDCPDCGHEHAETEVERLRTVTNIADEAGARILDERNALHAILAHPQARDLLEHHRHLDSGECSCQAYHAYGPADMDRDQWVAHVVDDAKTRGIV